MKINNFRGDVSDISAKTATLMKRWGLMLSNATDV